MHVNHRSEFKRIIVYARHHRASAEVIESLNRLLAFLEDLKIATFLEPETKQSFDLDYPALSHDKMGQAGDLIIVIGGDGSLLSAARLGMAAKVPVIGVNRGRLGFLTDILPQTMEQTLQAVLDGQYQTETRFLLQAKIFSKKGHRFETIALNDIVIERGSETHLIEFGIWAGEHLVGHYRADGVIFSTPTGSTAYALSAGGPILHPKLNAILIVPMFPHRLSSRPLVLDAKERITLRPSESNGCALQLSADSHEQLLLQEAEWVTIEKHHEPFTLLHPAPYDYFEMLRLKLGWEVGGS